MNPDTPETEETSTGTKRSLEEMANDAPEYSSEHEPDTPTEAGGNNNKRRRLEDPGEAVHYHLVGLLPACGNEHGFAKGKGAKYRNNDQYSCRRKCNECNQAILIPAPTTHNLTEISTGDANKDLQNWVITCVVGEDEERDITFLKTDRFTDDHLIDAIMFAVNHIRNLHASIASLMDYQKRWPYTWDPERRSRPNVIAKAEMSYLTMERDHFEGAPRDGLEEDLKNAADELDYLKELEDDRFKLVAEAKKISAFCGKRLWEAEKLYELGLVDGDWIEENCRGK